MADAKYVDYSEELSSRGGSATDASDAKQRTTTGHALSYPKLRVCIEFRSFAAVYHIMQRGLPMVCIIATMLLEPLY